MKPYHFNADEILAMHVQVMYVTDDMDQAGVKYPDRFEAMLARPQTEYFGGEQYSTVLEKACVYLHSISNDHIFRNGNKRTASHVFITYVSLHGLIVYLPKDLLENYIVNITTEDEYKGNDAIAIIYEDLKPHIGDRNDSDLFGFRPATHLDESGAILDIFKVKQKTDF